MAAWRAAFLAVSLLCAGCGWQPLYKAGAGGAAGPAQRGLAQTNVALIPERNGQLLRLALQDRFERFGLTEPHRYELSVSYGVVNDAVSIQQDNTSTRARITGSANWTLIAQTAQRTTLASGYARVVSGYNVIENQYFAADLESDNVQRQIAQLVADRITEQVATYFDRQQTASAAAP
jgi:LPS-assembly lipoprotein